MKIKAKKIRNWVAVAAIMHPGIRRFPDEKRQASKMQRWKMERLRKILYICRDNLQSFSLVECYIHQVRAGKLTETAALKAVVSALNK